MGAANILQGHPCREEAGGINNPLLSFSFHSLPDPPTDGGQQELRRQACSFEASYPERSDSVSGRTQSRVGKGTTWIGVVVHLAHCV